MEAQPHIPIYTSITQLLVGLGSISDHAATWNQLSDEFGSVASRPISSVHRAASSTISVSSGSTSIMLSSLPSAINRDILVACAPRRDPSREPCGAVESRSEAPTTVIFSHAAIFKSLGRYQFIREQSRYQRSLRMASRHRQKSATLGELCQSWILWSPQ
ncbi:hypothetical protein V8E52_006573 [Russula decolorans]